jgi:hypothetical protein
MTDTSSACHVAAANSGEWQGSEDMTIIRSVEELNVLYGDTSEASIVKVTKTLTAL